MSGKDTTDVSTNGPLDGWYLVRAYYKDAQPFATVMDLPREKALEVYKKTAPIVVESLGKGYDHLKERRKVEDLLRNGARTAGVDIHKENPVFFALTRDPEAFARFQLQPMPGNPQRAERKVIVIPAAEADLSACSFTYDDSLTEFAGMPDRGLPSHPLHGIVFNAQQMADVLKVYGEPGAPRYIEAQMWDRPSLKDFPRVKIWDAQKWHTKLQDNKPQNSHPRLISAGKPKP